MDVHGQKDVAQGRFGAHAVMLYRNKELRVKCFSVNKGVRVAKFVKVT